MRLFYIIILLICFPSVVFSQESMSRISLGLFFSPIQSYLTVDNKIASEERYYIKLSTLEYNYSSKTSFSTGGIIVMYKINEKLSIESGLSLVNRGFRVIINAYHEMPYLIAADSTLFKRSAATIAYHFLDLPLSVNHSIEKTPRYQTDFTIGISIGYILKSYSFGWSTFVNDSSFYFKEPMDIISHSKQKRFNLSITGGIRWQIKVFEQINFMVEPYFNYLVSVMNKSPESKKMRYLNIGLGLGIIYEL
jgi:hypothetical protein